MSFTLTDGSGAAVDPSGALTEGSVELDFVLAQLAQNADGSPAQYTAYTTLVQTSPITGASATQATTESTGTLRPIDVAQGTYQYDVAAPLAGIDPTLTQTVGALAVRTIASTAALASVAFSTRPDGGPIAAREVVTDATCDSCHRILDGHGGRWTRPEECILCTSRSRATPTPATPSTSR